MPLFALLAESHNVPFDFVWTLKLLSRLSKGIVKCETRQSLALNYRMNLVVFRFERTAITSLSNMNQTEILHKGVTLLFILYIITSSL